MEIDAKAETRAGILPYRCRRRTVRGKSQDIDREREPMITLALAVAAAAFGYLQTRRFVRRRLAYVDAVQNGVAPVLAGAAAFAVALPVAGLLPFVGFGTALLFGAGVGAGVSAGAKDTVRRRLGA
jgi:hypothetical protein